MNIKQIINKAFISGDWYVGYRLKENNKEKYNIIPEERKNWIADPFLFEFQGEHYLFVECVQNKKGVIAYYKFIKGIPVFQKVVIDEAYHLSYPCIFEYGNKVYMIPESADNGTVDVYQADDFPNQWSKRGTLLHGVFYDSTVLKSDGELFLFTYSKAHTGFKMSSYRVNVESMSIEHLADKQFKQNIGRPAGNFIFQNGMLIRPSQDCSRMYGEKLLLNKVEAYTDTQIEETTIEEIGIGNNTEYQRIHTYNSDSVYEVVDFFKEKISVLRPVKLIFKKIKQKKAEHRV